MRVIQGPDLRSLHEQLIPFIVKTCYREKDGKPTFFPGENHQDTIECKEFALFCKTPTSGRMFIPQPDMPFSQAFMDRYAHDLIYGNDKEHVYSYFERLRKWNPHPGIDYPIDQVDYIIEKLIHSPVTRRAIANTWYPNIDQDEEDVPCLQLVHCDTREGKLNMKVVFRSEDMCHGVGPNFYGLVRLQEKIAECVRLPIGSYTHVVFCPHLYMSDIQTIEKFTDIWW